MPSHGQDQYLQWFFDIGHRYYRALTLLHNVWVQCFHFFKRNYEEVDQRGREGTPFFFIGMHSALCGPNDDTPLPLIGEHNDCEMELGVIVGKSERYVSPDDAEDLIAAYVMLNDMGTVDEFKRIVIKFGYDWISKFQPDFKPFGPFAVPKEFVDRS